MRRFTFLLVLLIISAGCDAEGLVDPASAAPSGNSRSVQNGSTLQTQEPDSGGASTSSDGILIGSGTRSDSTSSYSGIGMGSGS